MDRRSPVPADPGLQHRLACPVTISAMSSSPTRLPSFFLSLGPSPTGSFLAWKPDADLLSLCRPLGGCGRPREPSWSPLSRRSASRWRWAAPVAKATGSAARRTGAWQPGGGAAGRRPRLDEAVGQQVSWGRAGNRGPNAPPRCRCRLVAVGKGAGRRGPPGEETGAGPLSPSAAPGRRPLMTFNSAWRWRGVCFWLFCIFGDHCLT